MPTLNEADVEGTALSWLEALGYAVLPGAAISPGAPGAERADYRDTVLAGRLREALARCNPQLPEEAREDAFRKLLAPEGSTLLERNRSFHRALVDGVEVEYPGDDGAVAYGRATVLDFDRLRTNDWLAVHQLTVAEGRHQRRFDIVLFVNGLPLAVIELKSPTSAQADVGAAIRQLQTYQTQLPAFFAANAVLVASDGFGARIGVLGAGREWWKPWRTIGGTEIAPSGSLELEVLLQGVFERHRFLSLVRHFLVFEDRGAGQLDKKMAGYHQFHAVNWAVEQTLRAMPAAGDAIAEPAPAGTYESWRTAGGAPGDRRVGVVWHTQGAGKSLTMAFYAGRLIVHPAMKNPTLVILTDRNDLDDQLFRTFARCRELLRQPPVQAASRADLREKLRVSGGGVIFTTIQKFLPPQEAGAPADRQPVLSARRNVVVLADEAHRSQYDFLDGFAAHLHDALPNASFIGFTGTPIERADANTRAVFGDYISIYDIRRAVEDGATVPIYYESRLAKLDLDPALRPRLDAQFEEVTEGEEVDRKEALKSRWSQLERIVGATPRLRLVAGDLVAHLERRAEAMLQLIGDEGKAMVVCMSRRIAVDLYREIVALRPAWHGEADGEGAVKVVMTGSAADPLDWQPHIRNPARREALADRFRDPADPFRLVIVRDMWLTGFDAPSLHTLYLDKPMHAHGLMQAIARVNRVFRDKPGGLVVDYLGLADALRQALDTYTESGGQGRMKLDQEEAVRLLLEKHEVAAALFHGFDRSRWAAGTPAERLTLLAAAADHIRGLRDGGQDGKARLHQAVGDLARAFALAVPHPETTRLRDDVAFFQQVKAAFEKTEPREIRSDEELDHAIRGLVSKAVVSDEVVDLFAAAGLKKPDLSILSDEFLAELQSIPYRNLAVELLERLLKGEIRERSRRNVVQARSFAELLAQTVRRYQNRAVETAQVIEELIALAREMRAAAARGEALHLTDDELAFYDALETNDSAVKILGEPTLVQIARELVATVKSNVTLDWTLRDNVRAHLRVLVKRILRKYGYPPDKQAKATETVLEQAAVLSEHWVTG